MNDERDRPYICRAPGCSQRFQTEDHLMIHRHKHEMTLKFPSIKADNAFSDQTPTPTRFLRNCDAVGLFNEIEEEFRQAQEEEQNKQSLNQNGSSCANLPQARLQHQLKPHLQHPVQTDVQAQHHHSQTQGQAHLIGPSCSMNAQQTLASSQAGSVMSQATATLTHSGPIPGPLSSLLHMRNRQRRPLPPSMPGTLPDPTIQGASAQHMAMERQMSSVSSSMIGIPGPAHSTSCSSPQRSKPPAGHQMQHHPGSVAGSNRMTIMGHMMEMMSQRHRPSHLQQEQHHQLQAPPTSYQQHCHAPPTQHMGNTHSHQVHQSGSAAHPQAHQSPPSHLHSGHSHQGSPHMSLHSLSPQTSPEQRQSLQHSHSQNPSGGGRRRRTLDQDPDERRQKFLERNRAAATRCRQKRKVWVGSLEKKAEELTHTNMQLQNEVTSLKSEVGQLKQILLTHKDCPVTARQREAQGYPNTGMSLGEHAAPVCQQQAIQHNSISTSSAAGGDKGHQRHAGN